MRFSFASMSLLYAAVQAQSFNSTSYTSTTTITSTSFTSTRTITIQHEQSVLAASLVQAMSYISVLSSSISSLKVPVTCPTSSSCPAPTLVAPIQVVIGGLAQTISSMNAPLTTPGMVSPDGKSSIIFVAPFSNIFTYPAVTAVPVATPSSASGSNVAAVGSPNAAFVLPNLGPPVEANIPSGSSSNGQTSQGSSGAGTMQGTSSNVASGSNVAAQGVQSPNGFGTPGTTQAGTNNNNVVVTDTGNVNGQAPQPSAGSTSNTGSIGSTQPGLNGNQPAVGSGSVISPVGSGAGTNPGATDAGSPGNAAVGVPVVAPAQGSAGAITTAYIVVGTSTVSTYYVYQTIYIQPTVTTTTQTITITSVLLAPAGGSTITVGSPSPATVVTLAPAQAPTTITYTQRVTVTVTNGATVTSTITTTALPSGTTIVPGVNVIGSNLGGPAFPPAVTEVTQPSVVASTGVIGSTLGAVFTGPNTLLTSTLSTQTRPNASGVPGGAASDSTGGGANVGAGGNSIPVADSDSPLTTITIPGSQIISSMPNSPSLGAGGSLQPGSSIASGGALIQAVATSTTGSSISGSTSPSNVPNSGPQIIAVPGGGNAAGVSIQPMPSALPGSNSGENSGFVSSPSIRPIPSIGGSTPSAIPGSDNSGSTPNFFGPVLPEAVGPSFTAGASGMNSGFMPLPSVGPMPSLGFSMPSVPDSDRSGSSGNFFGSGLPGAVQPSVTAGSSAINSGFVPSPSMMPMPSFGTSSPSAIPDLNGANGNFFGSGLPGGSMPSVAPGPVMNSGLTPSPSVMQSGAGPSASALPEIGSLGSNSASGSGSIFPGSVMTSTSAQLTESSSDTLAMPTGITSNGQTGSLSGNSSMSIASNSSMSLASSSSTEVLPTSSPIATISASESSVSSSIPASSSSITALEFPETTSISSMSSSSTTTSESSSTITNLSAESSSSSTITSSSTESGGDDSSSSSSSSIITPTASTSSLSESSSTSSPTATPTGN